MKHYEKPTVEMYSLCGNETICGGCDEKLKENENLNILFGLDYGNLDGVLTEEEADMLFGMGDDCKGKIQVEGYCKFTGAAQNISWS